jgi:hypothetical protein
MRQRARLNRRVNESRRRRKKREAPAQGRSLLALIEAATARRRRVNGFRVAAALIRVCCINVTLRKNLRGALDCALPQHHAQVTLMLAIVLLWLWTLNSRRQRIAPMRAIKSWLSLLAAVVALLVANPGFASVVGASDHSALTAGAAPSHCASMLGDHAPGGGKPASACEHCLLCGVAFVAPPEAPTPGRVATIRRFEPLAVEPAARPQVQASAHRARAPPAAA